MLDFYFTYCGVRQRLRGGALGNEMDRLAAHFFEFGYKRASAKLYISRLARFSEFAFGLSGTGAISQDVVDRFLQSFLTASPRIAAATAIEHARRVAPERFSRTVSQIAHDPDAALLAAYLDYLRGVKGLELNTCDGNLLGGRRFLPGSEAMVRVKIWPPWLVNTNLRYHGLAHQLPDGDRLLAEAVASGHLGPCCQRRYHRADPQAQRDHWAGHPIGCRRCR